MNDTKPTHLSPLSWIQLGPSLAILGAAVAITWKAHTEFQAFSDTIQSRFVSRDLFDARMNEVLRRLERVEDKIDAAGKDK